MINLIALNKKCSCSLTPFKCIIQHQSLQTSFVQHMLYHWFEMSFNLTRVLFYPRQN